MPIFRQLMPVYDHPFAFRVITREALKRMFQASVIFGKLLNYHAIDRIKINSHVKIVFFTFGGVPYINYTCKQVVFFFP